MLDDSLLLGEPAVVFGFCRIHDALELLRVQLLFPIKGVKPIDFLFNVRPTMMSVWNIAIAYKLTAECRQNRNRCLHSQCP